MLWKQWEDFDVSEKKKKKGCCIIELIENFTLRLTSYIFVYSV